ncbi:NucA/NucB deoxyribonuclease domain-containing protein [Streptomyces atacamensis]|uniref:NucA/NucB deoxyribonuclease domain-containing protein n=1 Tax=Streptomyces atacamensis TaxID=531966 RepID=UPI00399D311E
MNRDTGATFGPAAVDIDIIDCQNEPYSYTDSGLVIDHFSWCQASYYDVEIKRCTSSGSCTTVGKANFRLTTIGHGTDGDRKVEFVTLMDDVTLTGDVGQVSSQLLRISMECTPYSSAQCTADANNGKTDTISGWQSVPSTFFRFTSPLTGSTGTDQISWYDFHSTLTLVGANSVEMGGNGFRCDSATYVYNKGCVFDLVIELWYDLSVSNPDVDETAYHIYEAQYWPDRTVPSWEGKTVPGSIDSSEPLTRVYHDKSLRDANHRKAVSTCRQYFGDDYAQRGLDCDEYPFQSTLQGAAAGDNRYSARALTSSDNQNAGNLLGQWYGSQRILDGDPFYVAIIE